MILYGKPVADALREQYAEWIEEMAWQQTLTVLVDGSEDPQYLAAIRKEAERWKIHVQCSDCMSDAYIETHVIDICECATEVGMHSVDGQSVWGRAGAYEGEIYRDTPCTAEAIICMLDYYNIPIAGKRAVVIGRSERVGKPTAMLLLARDATVTVCHSKTDKGNLLGLVAGADIVVCAAGQKGLLDWTCVHRGCTVINVGGDYVCDGYEEYDTGLNLIPFKGGVGPVTTAVLMSHVLM